MRTALVTLIMCLLAVPASAKYSGGTGEPNDPYQIATAADLITLGETPADYGKHFVLTADIDLDPNLPGRKVFDKAVIADRNLAFTGVFDGNGYMIAHLTIEGGDYLGLFGCLKGGVKDLGLVDINVLGSGFSVGGLVGVNEGSIAASYSTGSVSGTNTVGGLVGDNIWWSRIVASTSSASVSGRNDVGGLVGSNDGSIATSYSSGSVSGTNNVGGLVGRNFVGWFGSGSIVASYSSGSVNGTTSVGGLVGSHESGNISSSFWDIQTSGWTTSAGGTGKTTAEMKTAKTFLDAGWDFVGEAKNGTKDIWWIHEGMDYPRLWWQYGRAFSPSPPNHAADLMLPLTLGWIAGGPALLHDIYLGEDPNVVAQATVETLRVYRGRQAGAVVTHDPGLLQWAKIYYWRIDEVNEADPNVVCKGSVWHFTTADHIVVSVVDDFESYTDSMMGQAIFQTWLDGAGYWSDPNDPNDPPAYAGNGTGSVVGYELPPFAEQQIVHGGRQSMPMDYNSVKKPGYSEAERTWATPQDLTGGGADTLTLYFRGNADNHPEPLYIRIEDSTGRAAVVGHPDTKAVQVTEWQKWHIALSEGQAAGVDMAAVKKMVIGVGNRNNPQPGGTGRIYIDDIRLTKRTP